MQACEIVSTYRNENMLIYIGSGVDIVKTALYSILSAEMCYFDVYIRYSILI